MNSLSRTIRHVLEGEKASRQDDSALLFAVYERHGLILSDEQKTLLKTLPPPNSVLRIGNRERRARKTQQP